MLKQVCKIGCLVMVLGLLSFPAWSSDNGGMNTDQFSIFTHGGYGPGDCGRVYSNDSRLILARGGKGGDGAGAGTGGEGPEGGTGNDGGNGDTEDNGRWGPGGTEDNGPWGPADCTGDCPEDGSGWGPGECECLVIVSG